MSSYLVLARKYRPATFGEVVGQEHVTRTIGNAFATGRVHHAFLFCGPRGCGKTTLARIVGKALNCLERVGAEPCGTCSACASIANGSAVDYQEMDGASNRGIDAIRELTDAVRYQPAVLRKKVYVIDEVHMLTTEAFNALLKTLEEPPPHVTFVLATTEPHKLPNTILSRCQRYDFKLVPASRLAQYLTKIFASEQLAIDANAVSLLVRESGGSVRDVLSLSDQLISYVGNTTITERHVAEVLGVADRSLTRTLVHSLSSGDAGAALGAVESAIERGVDEIQVSRAIVRYLRDLAVLQVAPERTDLVDAADEERAELLEEARGLDRSRVTLMFERMLRCCDELGKTLQPRLVLDCALIDVATVEPLIPLGDLVQRLGELESRLSRGGARAPAMAPRAPRPEAPAVMVTRVPAESHASAGGGSGSSHGSRTEIVAAPASGATSRAAPKFAAGTDPGSRAPAAAASARAAAIAQPASTSDAPSATPSSSAPGTSANKPTKGNDFARGTDPGSKQPAGVRVAAATARDAAPEAHSSTESKPTSMQPSGPVPKAPTVASGSGPHDEAAPVRQIGVPSSEATALTAWNEVLGELEARRKFSLLGPFQHARVMKWTSEEIDLGFPIDVHSMGEMAADRQNVDDLRTIVRELGSELKNIKVSVRLLDAAESERAGARSVLETTREKSSVERQKREAEAREHPITKHVLQTFGAQIKEIKTDV